MNFIQNVIHIFILNYSAIKVCCQILLLQKPYISIRAPVWLKQCNSKSTFLKPILIDAEIFILLYYLKAVIRLSIRIKINLKITQILMKKKAGLEIRKKVLRCFSWSRSWIQKFEKFNEKCLPGTHSTGSYKLKRSQQNRFWKISRMADSLFS